MAHRVCVCLLAAVTVAGGCSLRPSIFYVRVAEGLTAPSLAEGIRVAPRMFAPSQIVAACRIPRAVARLEAASEVLDLQVGERFALTSLRIVAVNAANLSMPDVPITIEAEDMNPPVLQLRSDDPDLDHGRIHPLNAGIFRMRIRTMCGSPGVEMTITGRVAP